MNKKWLSLISELFYPLAEVAIYENGHWVEIFNPLSPKKEFSSSELGLFVDEKHQQKVLRLPNKDGFVEITFNQKIFHSISESLLPLIGSFREEDILSPRENILQSVNDYLSEKRLTLNSLSRLQKKQIVLKLYNQGFFDIKDGSTIIADILKTSRSTIYNYLSWAQTVKKIQIHQVDTFTSEQFKGNPAGVVLDAQELSEETMQKIAREMHLAETSFVMPSDKADYKFRYFTASGVEVDFCGHSSVGAMYMLAHEKNPGHYKYKVETNLGILQMEAKVASDESIQVIYETPKIRLVKSSITHKTIAKELDIPIELLDKEQPIIFEKTNRDLFVTINSLEKLKSIQIDPLKAAQFSKKHDIVVICLLTTETLDKKSNAHIRCFAPAVGIPEDIFTGSVLGGLAKYLSKNNQVDTNDIIIEQGHFLNRGGSVHIELKKDTASITAQAIHFFSTEINLL